MAELAPVAAVAVAAPPATAATPSYEFISYSEGWRCTKCDCPPMKTACHADTHCVRKHGDPSFVVPAVPKKKTTTTTTTSDAPKKKTTSRA